MKLRIGFVSNSSSASFILKKDKLTAEQVHIIKNHGEVWKALPQPIKNEVYNESWCHTPGEPEVWRMKETPDKLFLGTTMTNFDMDAFFRAINLPMGAIEYEGDFWWGEEDWEPVKDEGGE
jgi:hypothetical protein